VNRHPTNQHHADQHLANRSATSGTTILLTTASFTIILLTVSLLAIALLSRILVIVSLRFCTNCSPLLSVHSTLCAQLSHFFKFSAAVDSAMLLIAVHWVSSLCCVPCCLQFASLLRSQKQISHLLTQAESALTLLYFTVCLVVIACFRLGFMCASPC